MSLVTKLPDSAKIVHLPDKLTMQNASSIRKEFIDMIDAGKNRLVLDMTDVSFTDSSGLAVLVAAYKGVKESNGCAVLLSPQPNVQSLLELTRLQELFEIFEDENTAVKRVSEP